MKRVFAFFILLLLASGCASNFKPEVKSQEAQLVRSSRSVGAPEIILRRVDPALVAERVKLDFKNNPLLDKEDLEGVKDNRVRASVTLRTCFEYESRGPVSEAGQTSDWSGDVWLTSGESRPLVNSRFEPLLCTEKPLPDNAEFVVRLRTPYLREDKKPVIALFSWSRVAPPADLEPVGSALSLEALSIDLKTARMQSILGAIRAGQKAKLESEIPQTGAWAPFDYVMMGGIAAAIASQGQECYEDLIQYLFDVGAELTAASVTDSTGYLRTQVYSCPLFAREMYRWVPAERAAIAREVRNLGGNIPGKSLPPEKINELQKLIEKEPPKSASH